MIYDYDNNKIFYVCFVSKLIFFLIAALNEEQMEYLESMVDPVEKFMTVSIYITFFTSSKKAI